MMPEWKIGCAGFHMKLSSYFNRYNVVEVQETFFDPPAARTLKRWRRQAPENFSFVIRAWQLITHPPEYPGYRKIHRPREQAKAGGFGSFQPGEQVQWAWNIIQETAALLDAVAILFQTPATFTPTQRNRENLVRFFSALDRGMRHLVWDPEGIWEEKEVEKICDDLGLIPAQDPVMSKIDSKQNFYFRMKTKTRGRGEYDSDDFYTILDRVEQDENRGEGEGFVIWNTAKADRDAKQFQSWIRKSCNEQD